MSKTIADRLNEVHNTGKEAEFYDNDTLKTGTAYEFTPTGLLSYIAAEGGYLTETVTGAELVSAGAAITIPTGSTLNAALQIIIDAVDPGV